MGCRRRWVGVTGMSQSVTGTAMALKRNETATHSRMGTVTQFVSFVGFL